jgi:hypothetical protein
MRSDKVIDAKEVKYKQALTRSSLLRRNGAFLSEAAVNGRSSYFNHSVHGILRAKVHSGPQPPFLPHLW